MKRALQSVLALLILLLVANHAAEAQFVKDPPVGHIVRVEDEYPTLNIGPRRSVAEGNRASLRALARLIRRYPHDGIYYVRWSVRVRGGALTKIYLTYAEPEQCVMRDEFLRPGDNEIYTRTQYEGVFPEDIAEVARKGGSFQELDTLLNNRTNANARRKKRHR